jgi:hypothetical protein
MNYFVHAVRDLVQNPPDTAECFERVLRALVTARDGSPEFLEAHVRSLDPSYTEGLWSLHLKLTRPTESFVGVLTACLLPPTRDGSPPVFVLESWEYRGEVWPDGSWAVSSWTPPADVDNRYVEGHYSAIAWSTGVSIPSSVAEVQRFVGTLTEGRSSLSPLSEEPYDLLL